MADLRTGEPQVQGDIAHDSADQGNPVKIGGRYRATPPAVSDNDRVDALFDSSGRLAVLSGPGFNIKPANDVLSSNGDTIVVPCEGAAFVSLYVVSSTLLATVDAELTWDDVNWKSTGFLFGPSGQSGVTEITNPTANDVWNVETHGARSMRLRVTAFTSGTSTWAINVTDQIMNSKIGDTRIVGGLTGVDLETTEDGQGEVALHFLDSTTWTEAPGTAANGLDVDVTRVQGTVTVDSELPAAAALADNASNPTVPGVGSFGMLFDGSTWDRAPGNSAGGAYSQGPAAADAAVAGNPLLSGGRASTATPTAVSADGDVVSSWLDRSGATIVNGRDAPDAALAAATNPVPVGGRASSALPTAMSADGDAVMQWLNRNGATVAAILQHLGLIGDPYTLTSKTAQYTSTQTGVALWTPAGGKKLVIVSYQIQAGGTTAGTMQLWFGASGDTTYSRGTDLAIFDGEFAPSATLKPGVVQNGLWIASAADHILRVTDSAAINPLTVTVWGYEI